ncbi:carbohydrate ABC transporter permease [Nonomuraea sp. KC401]|uniref:carbohydrate ABC transporter permease n=1 Tax=unclassified Nonomuraea TaxID=2593643 RepID=UPI0010FEF028|nr:MULTISPECIES: carbohydrate ABC transporter permease [unclassified Nonomuraea]NBE98468.1 ABC transporter permease subunit [Nonomuraea sp. K271]TLF60952.1 carbohydrate ABC transporter permease [Nonomuraea sp. KC401]
MTAAARTGVTWRARLFRRPSPGQVVTVVLLLVLGGLWIYPFAWLVSASLKSSPEIFGRGLDLLPEQPVWENYARAWTEVGFATYFVNTLVITVGTVLLVVVRSALAGYVLGRYDFAGKKLLIGVFLVTFFLPEGYTIIPITQLTDQLSLLNTHVGVILGLGAGGQIASTLLYAGYFRRLPKELEETARLDGAGHFTIFFRVMLPLAWPITATVVILTFLYAWNVYLLPLVFTLSEPGLRTLAVGMTVFVGERGTDWSGMAAAAVISLIPVIAVFVVLQRKFVDSIAGAVKQ